jgi:hypothetical protein
MVGRIFIPLLIAGLAMLANNPAYAFRCGSRLVKEGMHESEVKAICGQPESERFLGYVIRTHFDRDYGPLRTRYYGGYPHEVMVSELVYNFGPRKLMRSLRFEDGFLVSIETIGYGYRE